MVKSKMQELREEADLEGVVAALTPYAASCQVSIPIPRSLWGVEITELQLSVRSSNGLMRAGLRTVGSVCECIMSDKGLTSLRNVGKKSIAEIKAAILTEAYARLDNSGRDAFWIRFVRENLSLIDKCDSKRWEEEHAEDLRKALAGQHIYPAWIHELQARELYPALDEATKSRISVESFAGDILKILIDAGDLISYQVATPQGEAHGLINSDTSAWSYDENGEISSHSTVLYVEATEKGKAYIRDLIKARFPGLDVGKR